MNPESPLGGQQPVNPAQQPMQPLPQAVPPQPMQPGVQPQQPQPGYPLFEPNKPKKAIPWLFVIPIVVLTLSLIALAVVTLQVFKQKEDYKLNSDQKVSAAVEAAKQETEKIKEAEFLEREKSPNKVYKGPAAFGSLSITYPKSWAAAVDETGASSAPVNGYFHPNFVPGVGSGTAFALRIQVVEQAYDQVLRQYASKAKQGKVRVSAYKAPKVPAILGSRIDGEIDKGLDGSVILLPLRDKTIKLSAESQSFMKDFNNIVLANFVFVP